MDIVTALAEINTRLGALTIASPISESVRKVWGSIPPDSVGVPDAPCFMNALALTDVELNASQVIEHYALRIQLFVKDADRDRGRAIVRSFWVAMVAAFAPYPILGGKVTDQRFRGGVGLDVDLVRAGLSYPGLDVFMDITIKNSATPSAA